MLLSAFQAADYLRHGILWGNPQQHMDVIRHTRCFYDLNSFPAAQTPQYLPHICLDVFVDLLPSVFWRKYDIDICTPTWHGLNYDGPLWDLSYIERTFLPLHSRGFMVIQQILKQTVYLFEYYT